MQCADCSHTYGCSPPTYWNISTKDIHPSIHAFAVSLGSPSSSYTGLFAVISESVLPAFFIFSSSTRSFKDTVVALRSIFTTGDSRRLQKLSTAASAIFRPQSVRLTPRTGPRREREKEKEKGDASILYVKDGETVSLFFYIFSLYALESGLTKMLTKRWRVQWYANDKNL